MFRMQINGATVVLLFACLAPLCLWYLSSKHGHSASQRHATDSADDSETAIEPQFERFITAELCCASSGEKCLTPEFSIHASEHSTDRMVRHLESALLLVLRHSLHSLTEMRRSAYFTGPTRDTTKNRDGVMPKMHVEVALDPLNGYIGVRDGGIGIHGDLLGNWTSRCENTTTAASYEEPVLNIARLVRHLSSLSPVARIDIASKYGSYFNSYAQAATYKQGLLSVFPQNASYYDIEEDPAGNTLGRGTEVRILLSDPNSHLPFDMRPLLAHLDFNNLVQLASGGGLHRFPVYLSTEEPWTEGQHGKMMPRPVPTADLDANHSTWRKLQISAEAPIWQRLPTAVSIDKLTSFAKLLTEDAVVTPAVVRHFSVIGEIEYRGIVIIPQPPLQQRAVHISQCPNDNHGIHLLYRRLYIRKFLFLPPYLCFVHGVIDTDDLPSGHRVPFNESRMFKVIMKKLHRIVLDGLLEWADRERITPWGENSIVSSPGSLFKPPSPTMEFDAFHFTSESTYSQFWYHYGTSIQQEFVSTANKTWFHQRRERLLRFQTS